MTEYPPPDCGFGPDCAPCRAAGFVFRCVRCGLDQPWCYSADDEEPEWCDGCWAAVYGDTAITKAEGR